MCIICFKPAGENLPSDEAIKHMFRTNPHGAGYALQGYLDGRHFTVKYKKGFMDVDSFIKAIRSEGNEDYLRQQNIAMHFRIKTSGETDEKTTHPFIITDNFYETQRTEGQGKPILFHNGVFPKLGGIVNDKASDTQDFVVGVASKYLKTPYHSKVGEEIAKIVVDDCRVLVMYPSSKTPTYMMGTWHKFDGCYYSNGGYYDPNKVYYGSYTSLWDDDEWYGRYSRYDDEYYKDKYYRTHRRKTVLSENHVEDRFGRNIHEYAWPSSKETWIKCPTPERYNILAAQARLLMDDVKLSGLQLVYFPYNKEEQWYADPNTLQFFKVHHIDDYMELEELAMLYREFNAELDDNYLQFTSDEDMTDWLSLTTQGVTEFERKWAGKTWFVDVIMLEAYTLEGIKEEYKDGAWGHAIKYLREEGTLYNKNLIRHKRYTSKNPISKKELDQLFPDDDLPALLNAHGTTEEKLEQKQYSGA